MAKDKSDFTTMDTPYQVQPPKGSAEPGLDYGGVAGVAGREPRDPMGVMPENTKQKDVRHHEG